MDNGFPAHAQRWPQLLSFAAHEIRNPAGVIAGYLRMLLSDRMGPLTDRQRHILEEVAKSSGRLSALADEMSYLSRLEGHTATFTRSRVPLGALLADTIGTLPPMPDREVAVLLDNRAGGAAIQADPAPMKSALMAVLAGLRREVVKSNALVVRVRPATEASAAVLRVVIAEETSLDAVDAAGPEGLDEFRECRGGCGLSLATARNVIAAHDGHIWSPSEDHQSAAIITLPTAA